MKKTIIALIALAFAFAATAQERITIRLMGDSTCATINNTEGTSYRGWGQLLPFFFDNKTTIVNYAKGGASTKTFQSLGLWDKVKEEVLPGDIVLIQFGHNDENTGDRGTTPDEYKENLTLFVTTLKDLGATPVLITPICRRRFINGHAARYAGGNWNHLNYSPKMFDVAKEQNVKIIDGEMRSLQWLESLGAEKAKEYYTWFNPGDYPKPAEGKKDDTHLNQRGAFEIAGMFAYDLTKCIAKTSAHYVQAQYSQAEEVLGPIKVYVK